MIGVDQRWLVRIAPAFGVEMQAKHQIGMQFEVHERRPSANLAIPVE